MKYGLYDENDNLIKTWKELTDLGLNIEKDFVDTNTYFSVDPSSGYSVFKENNLSGILVIPKPIKRIGCNSFRNSTLTGLVIPQNVKKIGKGAFAYNANLKTVLLYGGESTKIIESHAFRGCNELNTIIIGDNVKIDSTAFFDCQNIKAIFMEKDSFLINPDFIKAHDANLIKPIVYTLEKAESTFTTMDDINRLADVVYLIEHYEYK